ncbi:hypothetical protein [Streptomyces sp. 6N223]|uniref:hypothetical protein n=1 Tax=Streptomyces sp. 6N223 TaxID=3457412 RepID=UPI003FD47207
MLTPAGYDSLMVTPATVRVGDVLTIDGQQIAVVDMRAVGGTRDAVVLGLASGARMVMRQGMSCNALRARGRAR